MLKLRLSVHGASRASALIMYVECYFDITSLIHISNRDDPQQAHSCYFGVVLDMHQQHVCS